MKDANNIGINLLSISTDILLEFKNVLVKPLKMYSQRSLNGGI